MARVIALKPINEIVAKLRERYDRDAAEAVERYKRYGDEAIAKVDNNRRAFAMLDAAGIDLQLYEWDNGVCATIDLGFFPSTRAGSRALADKLRTIRVALESKLGLPEKGIVDDKRAHLRFTICPVDFPEIKIVYQRRLPKGAKCKIVTTRSTYRSLVCEA